VDGPAATVDVVIHRDGRVVLVRRRFPPAGWALPGGFVDRGEKVPAAAIREALEETGLSVRLLSLLHVYSDPARDPRRHTLSAVYIAEADGDPLGGDDAAEARWFSLDALPSPVAFDHVAILADAARFLRTGVRPDPLV
jgi:8-oxo-dGTP diphosphatase